jgi:hypothetical protein
LAFGIWHLAIGRDAITGKGNYLVVNFIEKIDRKIVKIKNPISTF